MKRNIVLGINDEHDAGCALIIDGQIVAAYEEERFSRCKTHNGQSDGMPVLSLKNILRDFSIGPTQIDYVAYNFPSIFYLAKQISRDLIKQKCSNWILSGFLNKKAYGVGDYLYPWFYFARKKWKLDKLLKKYQINTQKVARVDHHTAHAASAYYASGLPKALILTLDGQGSGLAGSISLGENGDITRKAVISKYNSIGMLYSSVTKGLGFRPNRHEGKILGLAAHGNPDRFYEKFKKLIINENLNINFKWAREFPLLLYPNFSFVTDYLEKKLTASFQRDRADISATLQKVTEEVIVNWAKNAVREFKCNDLALAGGVFANVKVNQKLRELPEVNSLFVFPAMGDGGLASGAALFTYYQKFAPGKNITQFNSPYLGKNFTSEQIKETLDRFDIPYTLPENIQKICAQLINDNKVVARYNDRAEFGPRALGNRSIMYSGKDKNVNKWLNKKLDRTEFMPFAPSTLWEDAHLYYDLDSNCRAYDFMTMTVNCKKRMTIDCPAAVHIDNTARPQLVKKEINPDYYQIINEYKKLSGSSTIVNTSFNAHEEPIVNSPRDAIRNFLVTRLDVLAIGDYLVKKDDL